jgi:hypothetical protein
MATVLELPPDLMPRVLTYYDQFPKAIGTTTKNFANLWRRRDIDQAIQCARKAQALAQASNERVDESVFYVWMADLYREIGQLGPALKCCQEATNALRLRPTYEHRDHAGAVVAYVQGLLRHALGDNAEALANYQRSLEAFERAIAHWLDYAKRNPSQTSRYSKLAKECNQAVKWIEVLCQRAADEFSLISSGAEIYVTVIDGQDYDLIRLALGAYRLPLEIQISGQPYRLCDPGDGVSLKTGPLAPWNARYFAMRVPANQWAGPCSTRKDYILVQREQQLTTPEDDPGVLWDTNQEQWEYGRFIRDSSTGEIRFQPLSPSRRVIGGMPPNEEIKDPVGTIQALLKP